MKTKIIGLFGVMLFTTVAEAANSVPIWELEHNLHGVHSDFSRTVLDSSGNSYFAGYSVVKVDSDGRQVWATNLPSGFFEQALALDTNRNVYVAGVFLAGSTADLGLLKYDPNGHLVWQTTYDPADHTYDWANDVGCDAAGKCILQDAPTTLPSPPAAIIQC